MDRLVHATASLYRPAGRFAWHFARSKLARDPLFSTLLATGAIPDASCLVDLGCGQGLLATWLAEARALWMASDTHDGWPAGWPAPPKIGTYLGIDQSRRDVARARRALPPHARAFRGDLRELGPTMLERCDVATIFDVLQYLAPDAQERLLTTIHASLPPWGVLLLRVGDGGATRASRRANAVDMVVCALRGHPRLQLHRRPIDAWVALLGRIGFAVEVLDDERAVDRASTGFANVLLRASRTVPATVDAHGAIDARTASVVTNAVR